METPKLCIAVVDDQPLVRKALRRMLQQSDMDVSLFASGADFLRFMISDRTVDVAIIDINMPGMSGFEVCEQLVNASVSLPVIFITGNLDAGIEHQAQHSILLRKPVSSEALLAAIAIAVRSKCR